MKAGGIDQDQLGVGISAHADNATAGGLRLGRYYRNLLSDDLVHQG
jgi:hypothetical protein